MINIASIDLIERSDIVKATGDLSNFYTNDNPSGFITAANLSNYVSNSQTGEFYPASNPSGFITGGNLVDVYNAAVEWTPNHTLVDGTRYLAGDLVYFNGKIYKANYDNESIPVTSELYWTDLGNGYRLNIDGRDILNIPMSQNVVYTTGDQSISGVKTFEQGTAFNERPTVNGTGVLLIGEAATTILENVVYTTGNQSISGVKTFEQGIEVGIASEISTLFASGRYVGINNEFPVANLDVSGTVAFNERPTVNGTGVLLNGEVQNNTIISGIVYSAQINVKNDQGSTIYKGQPAYIKGANGGNILIGLASNEAESMSSKTLGLIVQDSIEANAFGTVITEGLLEKFDVGTALAGDPIWLGPSGTLIYGLTNKPHSPEHLVYLGVVTRQGNNGEVFVHIQNGFELEELHNAQITGALDGDFIVKSGEYWINQTIVPSSIGAVSAEDYQFFENAVTGDIAILSNEIHTLSTGVENSIQQLDQIFIKKETSDTIVINNIRAISQSAYDALEPGPDPNTLYIISYYI